MSIFNFRDEERIGVVESVDTASVVVRIQDEDKLKQLQVNHLVVLRSSKVGQYLIGIVTKIMRKAKMEPVDEDEVEDNLIIENVVKITLIGTHVDKVGTNRNIFKRTLETVPEIEAECFVLNGERLTKFMQAISQLAASSDNPLSLGHYTLDEEAQAFLDGNKFFQRHAVVVGSTGSGKSWSVARLLEQISPLNSGNALVFDIHGEYAPFESESFQQLKIAGPNQNPSDNVIFLPYWLLTYEEMIALMLDRSDNNAPNQAMAFSNAVIEAKRSSLEAQGKKDVLQNFTIDSPVPFDLNSVFTQLSDLDNEMVAGARGQKQGPLFGKLTRFLQRLDTKRSDRRLNFLFNNDESLQNYSWMESLCKSLLQCKSEKIAGVKIIDFSEVPSDILPLIIGLVARLVFSIQMWAENDKRHPIALFCDEAHLYIPEKTQSSIDIAGLNSFERIAKEGRKYGIGLVVISQRPAEVNRTVLSQSSNFVAMRLTNAEDQSVIKRLLPDSLGNFSDLLPILDVGEALIVGDSSLLPSRIRVSPPNIKPNSATIDFWNEWSKDSIKDFIPEAVESLRRQSKQ